jgi:hypothetical protein
MPENVLVIERDGNRGIGKRGRGREPVGRRDIEADQPGHRGAVEPDAGKNGHHQAEGGDALGEPLRAAASRFQRSVNQRQREHRMRHHGSGDSPGHLL